MRLTRSEKILLIGIIVLSFVLRFYKLSEYPVGFHGDEASLSYNAYSILKTGRDENGDFLPLHSYISKTYRPIGYTYIDIIPVYLFGLNEFSARFPSAFFGSLTVIAIFFLSYSIFLRKNISLISSFLLAVSPWHINLSRSSTESLTSLFFIVFGFYFFILRFREKRNTKLFLSFLIFIISFVIYPAPRVFVPLLLVLLSIFLGVSLPKNLRKKVLFSVLVFISAIFISVFLLVFRTKGGAVKFKDVGILSYQQPVALLGEAIREDGQTNPIITRFFHNKVKTYSSFFISEYFKYFSFDYLFGGGIYPVRYRIPQTSLLYLVEIPFILFGVYTLFQSKEKFYLIPLLWFIAGPVSSSFTWEDTPNVLRSLPMLPSFPLISAFGFVKFIQNKKVRNISKFFILGILIIFIYSFISFLHQYFVHAKLNKPWYRDYGFKELVSKIKGYYPNYNKIMITKAQPGPYIHLLFYLQYDPLKYQKEGSARDDDFKGFDKYIFIPNDCPSPGDLIENHGFDPSIKDDKILYVVSGNCKVNHEESTILDTIYRTDNSPVFGLVEFN